MHKINHEKATRKEQEAKAAAKQTQSPGTAVGHRSGTPYAPAPTSRRSSFSSSSVSGRFSIITRSSIVLATQHTTVLANAAASRPRCFESRLRTDTLAAAAHRSDERMRHTIAAACTLVHLCAALALDAAPPPNAQGMNVAPLVCRKVEGAGVQCRRKTSYAPAAYALPLPLLSLLFFADTRRDEEEVSLIPRCAHIVCMLLLLPPSSITSILCSLPPPFALRPPSSLPASITPPLLLLYLAIGAYPRPLVKQRLTAAKRMSGIGHAVVVTGPYSVSALALPSPSPPTQRRKTCPPSHRTALMGVGGLRCSLYASPAPFALHHCATTPMEHPANPPLLRSWHWQR
ncbi:hypothetical protein DFH06DRAFT_1341535 [Mycena polygramma]|nr:hypothetical protein DFH06DRAFT_1341535 [Mycena polygramma]